MKKTFRHGSLATYSLMQSSEMNLIQEKIHEAYKTLGNERERLNYDLTLSPYTQPELTDPGPPNPNCENPVRQPETSLGPELHGFLSNIDEVCTGKLLRKYREWMGIHLEEIALETRINPEYLHLIEEDLYSRLPNEVFLRSYLQQYAKCLGINSKEVSEGFLKKYRFGKNLSPRI
jgi:hypothetical protein